MYKNFNTIEKEISKKRQFRACDFCRKSKKKCDGKSPCSRCKDYSHLCIYSLRSIKRSKKNKDNMNNISKTDTQISLARKNSSLADTSLSRYYLDIYFKRINPTPLISSIDMISYENPKSKSILLQYNAILATATRAFSNERVYHSFEMRAKQLAGELISDYSYDTAFGFHLLAYHLWGENDNDGCHYRDITLSLCKRILRTINNQDPIQGNIYQLEMAASIINNIGETDFILLDKSISKLAYFEEYLQEPMKKLFLLGKFQSKIWTYIFKDLNDAEYHINPFNNIDKIKQDELYQLLGGFEDILTTSFNLSEQNQLVIAVISGFKAMLCYSTKQYKESLDLCSKIADILESRVYLVSFCSPYFATICHLVFLIAYLQEEYHLANRLMIFLRKLADLFPSSRAIVEKDIKLLQLVNIKYNIPTASISIPNNVMQLHSHEIPIPIPSCYNQSITSTNNSISDFNPLPIGVIESNQLTNQITTNQSTLNTQSPSINELLTLSKDIQSIPLFESLQPLSNDDTLEELFKFEFADLFHSPTSDITNYNK